MVLTGQQSKEFSRALAAAFRERWQLDQMLYYRLQRQLNDYAGEEIPLPRTIFELLKSAESQGWVGDLVRAALQENPGNPELCAFYANVWMAFAVPAKKRVDLLQVLVHHGSGFQDVESWLTKLAETGRRVCCISFFAEQGGTRVRLDATGTLIDDDLVLTNYHVLEALILGDHGSRTPDGLTATTGNSDLRFRFDYRLLPNGTALSETIHLPYGSAVKDWLVAESRTDDADFAIVRLAKSAARDVVGDGGVRGFVRLPDPPLSVNTETSLLILQHPEGHPLKLDFNTVVGVDVAAGRINYHVNTEEGSSGSPCFNSDLEFVALHQAGSSAANRGIPLSAIRAHLGGPVGRFRRRGPQTEVPRPSLPNIFNPPADVPRPAPSSVVKPTGVVELRPAPRATPTPAAHDADHTSDAVPYFPGLEPWPSERSTSFGGRDEESDLVAAGILDGRFVLLTGSSGTGKSSLVNAGVLPRLRPDAIASRVVLTPGVDPFVSLIRALDRLNPIAASERAIDEAANRAVEDPAAFAASVDESLPVEDGRFRLIVIDQLEELMSAARDEPAALLGRRKRFGEHLAEYAQRTDRTLLLLVGRETVRESLQQPRWTTLNELFRDRNGDAGAGARARARHFRLVPPELSHDGLYKLIGRSSGRAGFEIEPAVIEQLYRDLHGWHGDDWLAIVGLVLAEMVRRWRLHPRSRHLSIALYDEIGGLAGVLGRLGAAIEWNLHHADDAVSRVMSLFVRERHDGTLVRRTVRSPQQLGAADVRIIARLTQQRLLHDGDGVRLADERLFVDWAALKTWTTRRRAHIATITDLEHAASMWDAARTPGRDQSDDIETFGGARLERAESILKAYPVLEQDLPLLRELVDVSRVHTDRAALIDALLKGQAELLVKLQQRKVTLTDAQIGELTWPAMYYAVFPEQLGSAVQIDEFFAKADLRGVAHSGFRVEHFAALAGRVDVLEMLVKRDVSLATLSAGGTSPFDMAAYSGSVPAMQYIWSWARAKRRPKRTLLEGQSREAATPLHWAAMQNRPEAIRWLLKEGANPTARTQKGGMSALHLAVLHGGPDGVDALLESTALDPSQTDDQGMTPLHWAVEIDALERIERLLRDPRVNVNCRAEATPHTPPNVAGKTPLHRAAALNNFVVVELLLAHPGIDLAEAKDGERSPLALTRNPEVAARLAQAYRVRPLWSSIEETPGQRPILRRLTGDGLRMRIGNDLAARAPATAWSIHPLVDGEWIELEATRATDLLVRLADVLPERFEWTFTSIDVVRGLPLAFYGDAWLYEARVMRGSEAVGPITFVEHVHGCTLLKGTSNPIHEMNARVPLKLASADVVADYVRFFCAAMIADDGTFRLFERPDLELLHFAPDAPAGLRSRVEALARTCRIVDAPADAPDGSTYLEAVVKYSSALVEAKFRVDVKGGVEMLEDRPLATNLPVMIETFVDGIRMWRPIAVSGPPEFAAVSATAETAASDTASNAGREAEAT